MSASGRDNRGPDPTDRSEAEAAVQLRAELAEARADNATLRLRVEHLEQELAVKHDELGAMLDAAKSTVILLLSPSPSPEIVLANHLAAEYFDTSVAELIGQPFEQFCQQHRDRVVEFDSYKQQLDRTMAQGEALEGVQVRLRRPAKTTSLFCCPIRSGADENLGWIWGLADITHIERAANQLRTVIEASPVPLIIARESDGQVLLVNDALCQLLGVAAADLVGTPNPTYHADEGERAAIYAQLATDGRVTDYQARVRCADGSERWALWSLVRSTLGDEEVVISALHDVDARKRAEDQLRSTLAALEQANERSRESHRQLLYAEKMAVLGTLVAGIAHEIKTPVGAINSMQHTLLRALEKLKKSLETACPDLLAQNKQLRSAVNAIGDANEVIETGSSRVLEIVKRLRSFARMDVCELQQVDVHEGLDDTLLLLHHETKNRIMLKKAYGELPRIRANAGQLNQVFLNVLVNAAQAIPERGTITITTSIEAGRVRIAIEDDGVGIAAEQLDKVFEPGFTTKGVGVGTGLGLAICRRIMQEHEGTIGITSVEGKGTCVTIELPSDLQRDLSKGAPECCEASAAEERDR